VVDAALLARAGHSYLRAGWPHEAARCYREAGQYLRAARAWESAGDLHRAAADYAAAGRTRQAAWLLVHHVGDAAAARTVMAADEDPTAPDSTRTAASALLSRLVLARCDVVEGADPGEAVDALRAVTDHLAGMPAPWFGTELESWAVDVASSMNRPDLVALIYAGAVRGGHHGAADRWDEWSRRTLGVPLQLPEPT
jgi:hypothetical protein